MDFAGMKRRELQALCKRHGLPAGGTNASLVARLDAALSGAAAEEEGEEVVGVAARKGCLKRGVGDGGEAKKVTFAAEESKGRRLRSRVVWSPEVARTRGRRAEAASTDTDADGSVSTEVGVNVPVRRSRRNSLGAAEAEEEAEAVTVGGNVLVRRSRRNSLAAAEAEGVEEAVTVGANVPVRRSRRNSMAAAEAEEVEEAVTVDRKRKRSSQKIAEDVAVSAEVVVPCRVTRRSSLSGATALLPSAVEKKRGRGKAADGKNKLAAEAQGLSAAVQPTVVESKRRREKEENCEPDVQNSAKVEVPARTTRSRSAEADVVTSTVVENKRKRKTGDAQPDVELRSVAEVPRNDAPVTRSLRNRVVQVNNSVVDETHTSQQLQNKMQPSRPATRRHQQVSSVDEEDQEQVAAPSKAPSLRQSRRNNPEASNANSEGNHLSSAVLEAKDSKVAHPLTRHKAKAEDMQKQPIVKEPVRRSTRKSIVSAILDNEEKYLVEENNPEAHVRRSTRKSIVPVKDIKGAGEEFQNAKGEVAVKQPAVKEPVRRSTRKSIVSAMHEKEEKDLIAEKSPEAHVRRSMRKSVVPVKDIKGVGEEIQNAKGEDVKKQLVVKQPVRRSSRKSVLPDPLENESRFLVKETSTEAQVSESRKTEDFGGQKFKNQQSAQTPSEKDNNGHNYDRPLRTHQATDSTTSKGRHSKKRRKTVPDEVMSAEVANDDMVIREATKDACKVSHECSKESNCKIQEICQNATKEEFSSGPLLGSVTLPDESTAQSVHKMTPVSESGDIARENSDKSTQPQEHPEIQADDSNLSEKGNGVLDQLSSIAELLPHNGFVSEDKILMGEESPDVAVDFTVGDGEGQSPVAGQGRVVWEANSSESGEKNVPDIMSTVLHTKSLQHDIDILAKETSEDVVPISFTSEEQGIKYPVSSLAVEKRVSGEASACKSAEKTLTGILGNDLHTKNLQHDCAVLTEQSGEASGSALPKSDNNPEINCDSDAEESIQAADPGRCPSKGGKGSPHLTNLTSEGPADDSVLHVPNSAKGCPSDGGHSSFGLEFLFTEEGKESCSRNVENAALEVDGGNKSSTCVTPGFYVGSDCGLEDEDVQPTGSDADKEFDVDQDVTEEEVVAEERSYDVHIAAKTDLKTKLNGELTGLDIAEKNVRIVADNPDNEEATIQVEQGNVQEGDPDIPSQVSATPECKREFGLPEEPVLQMCSSSAEQSPFGLQSLFSQKSIEKSGEYGALDSVTADTGNGFDELKDCNVKCALEKTNVPEPFSHHDTDKGSCSVSKNDDCMCTSQQDNGIEGLSMASFDGEWVLSGFSSDAKHTKEVTNSEEMDCKGEGSKKLVLSDDIKASFEKREVTRPADNAYGVSDAVLSSTLHAPANENYEACLGSNTKVLHQGHKNQCIGEMEERFASKSCTNDTIEDATAECIESGVILLPAEERSHLQDGTLGFKLQDAKVVESGLSFSKDISSILDNESVVDTVGERTLSVSDLPNDSPKECSLRQELLDGSAEASLDGSNTYGEKIVSRVGTIENPSFSLATPGCRHEGTSSEEAVRTIKKYAGTCSSNPRELLMDLQSLFSKENIEGSDPHDGFAFPSAESPEDKSTDVQQRVEGQKDRCSEDWEEQVASGSCTNHIVEPAAAKYMETSEERPNLKDGQLGPKQESPAVMESGLNCNKDVTNTSDNGSVVDIVGQRTPSGSDLPEDYQMDHNLQQEFLDGFSVESSLHRSTVFGKKIDSAVAGTIGNPSFSLATPDNKYEDALSEEAVRKMESYTGTCSADPRHLLMELQSLLSEGSVGKSGLRDDLARPSAESARNEPVVCHVEKLVDTVVSSEPDRYQRLRGDLSIFEEKESCMSISAQRNERGGFLRSSHMNDWVASGQVDLSDDTHLIERNIVAEVALREENEKRKSMPTSDSDILHEKLHFNYNQTFPKVLEINMSEAAPVEQMESKIVLPSVSGTSEMPDELLNAKLNDEGEKHSFSCGEDKDTIKTSCTGSVKNDLIPLAKDSHIDSCQKQEVPDDLSLPKSPQDSANCQDEGVSGSGLCQTSWQQCINESSSMQVTSNIEPLNQDHEGSNENDEGQTTPGIPASSVPEAADIGRSEREIGMTPPAGTSALPDEQLNKKVESHEVDEHNCCYDVDTLNIFGTESLNSKASSLHKGTRKDPPSDLPAPRSPEESTVLGSGSVKAGGNEEV